MESFLLWSQLIYNISFIVFTFLLVIYSIKSYNNQKKQPYILISRINYHFIEETNNNNLVFLDIFNAGDFVARMVEIHLIINHNPPILSLIHISEPTRRTQ